MRSLGIVNKLKQVNKLVNQFASSIQHKPLGDRLDNARVLAFIRALREVVADNNRVREEVVIAKREDTLSIEDSIASIKDARNAMKGKR